MHIDSVKKTICIDSAALAGILYEIDHNCSMLMLSNEDTAADDVEFYVPRIQRAAEELRRMIEEAKPVQDDT